MKIYRLPARLKTVIFDIDSTLYTNPEYAIEQVDVQIRHFAQLRGMTDEAARSMISAYREKWSLEHEGRKISMGNTMKAFGISIEESIKWRETLLDPAKYLQRDDHLASVLNKLNETYALICVTNNPVLPAEKTLKVLGVESYMTGIIGLDTYKLSKPAKEPLLLAAQQTGAAPQECLSVGDRYDIDLATALDMGMGGILVTGVEDVYTLPEILEKKGEKG